MRKILKWAGIAASSLGGLVLLCAAGVYVYGGRLDSRTVTLPPGATPWTTVAATPGMLARGRALGMAIGKCGEGHGVDLGGGKFIDDPALGSISAPNITAGRGGRNASYDDA